MSLLAGCVIPLLAIAVLDLRADVVEMQNGDRYVGKVLSVSSNTVVLSSETLGKINVPRHKVASLTFGTNVVSSQLANLPAQSVATNLPVGAAISPLTTTNVDVAAALRQLGANTDFVTQVRQQMLSGNPEAGAKYDEMVNGLLSGKLSLNDLRREAQASAKQLEDMKRELGPEADDLLDGYLSVLNKFLQETATNPKTSP